MTKHKLSNKSNTNSSFKWFNIKQIWSLILLLSVINLSCDKEDVDVYYVKYSITTSNITTGGKLNISFNTESNKTISIVTDQNAKWETIIGPVSKGFNAKIAYSNRTGTANLHAYAEIAVSKNNSPFAFKTSYGPESDGITLISGSLDHTIDY